MKSFLKRCADNTNTHSWANHFRRQRAKLVRDFIEAVPAPRRILDLGGTQDFWVKSGLADIPGISVTVLNLEKDSVSLPNFSSVAGDARDLSVFADKSFDIVFSNSVIEHVGSLEDQKKMAAEVARVGVRYFVQTPARSFPIEPHFLFPFFAVLPSTIRERLVMHYNLGWYKKIPDRAAARAFLHHFQLLSRKQFSELFPAATIVSERFLGLTKSYMAVSP